jgi:hypothetical protein
MTNTEKLIDLFRRNNYRVRLGEILKYPFGYEFRARATELRQKGFTITCERAKEASDNLYTMIEPGQNQPDLFAVPTAHMRGH